MSANAACVAAAARAKTATPLMPPLRPGDGVPDFGAAVRAFIDEVDLRLAPMRFDVPDEHGKQSHAAGADHRNGLDVVMLDVGWHIGSPSQRKHAESQPQVIYPRIVDVPHQLFRTDIERTAIVRGCCIPVTF